MFNKRKEAIITISNTKNKHKFLIENCLERERDKNCDIWH